MFKSPVERLQKDWQLDWTHKGCNWTAVAGCMVLGEVRRVVQDQLQLVAIETGLYRGRGIFYMKTEVFVDIQVFRLKVSTRDNLYKLLETLFRLLCTLVPVPVANAP